MNDQELLDALSIGEDAHREFESAVAGLPTSLFDTISAMANTEGGYIVLGVRESVVDGTSQFAVEGLPNPAKLESQFWNQANNPEKLSVRPFFSNQDVQLRPLADGTVLVVHVPRADRWQRPVYVGANPLKGTFRRNHEGDYRCTPDEVKRMLADQVGDEAHDARILEHFSLADLHAESLQQFRNRLRSRDLAHPWLGLDDKAFLEHFGGWRRDRASGREGLTVAGLLMFGKHLAITDVHAVPGFMVDYREQMSADPAVRWTDRVWPDGTWEANLLQFFGRAYQRLAAGLKVPFQMGEGGQRRDETLVHEAVREALVNALIHANYAGVGGIIVEHRPNSMEFSNPGTLLLPQELIRRGGVSECRNKNLQKMFALIGYGEKAGSGLDKIRLAWTSQHWRPLVLEESVDPERIRLTLSTESLLPPGSVERLRAQFGDKFTRLAPHVVSALVVAETLGYVTNREMQTRCDLHLRDITEMLRNLVNCGYLRRFGNTTGTYYKLPPTSRPTAVRSPHNGPDSPHNGPDSPHNGPDSPHNGPDSPHNVPDSPRNGPDESEDSSHYTDAEVALPTGDEERLRAAAQPYREQGRRKPGETRDVIRTLCEVRPLSASQIAQLLDRDASNLRDRFLSPMVAAGELSLLHPEQPNHPQQAYTVPKEQLPPAKPASAEPASADSEGRP